MNVNIHCLESFGWLKFGIVIAIASLHRILLVYHQCAINECDDDDGNNYLIAVTNVRIELNRIDFCVDLCGAPLCLYANENKYRVCAVCTVYGY